MRIPFDTETTDPHVARHDELGGQFVLGRQPADDAEPPAIDPVRLPAEADRLAAIRNAPVMRQLHTLADYCAPPGRALTAKGNLRLTDARHLVETLATGDDPTMDGRRSLRSAEDLPELNRLVNLAVEAGVVRRQQGRLLAVARFAALDECAAHEKVALTAIDAGLTSPHRTFMFPVLAQVHAVIDQCAVALLTQLVRLGDTGAEIDILAEHTNRILAAAFPGLHELLGPMLPDWTRLHLDRLAQLGMVTFSDILCADCGLPDHRVGRAAITAAGVPVTVELTRRTGVEVHVRSEPDTADAATIVDLIGTSDEQEWAHDAAVWFAAQPDPSAAIVALATEITAEHRDTFTVMSGIGQIDELAGDAAVAALRAQLGGPHDGLVLYWLLGKDAIDPATVDPARLVAGLIDTLAAMLDVAGGPEAVAFFDNQPQDEQREFLDSIWRIDHPRLPDVLDALGSHHPTKAIAKAARKALIRHRSRLDSAQPAGSSSRRGKPPPVPERLGTTVRG